PDLLSNSAARAADTRAEVPRRDCLDSVGAGLYVVEVGLIGFLSRYLRVQVVVLQVAEPVGSTGCGSKEHRSQPVAQTVHDASECGRREAGSTNNAPSTHSEAAVDPRAGSRIRIERHVGSVAACLTENRVLEIGPGSHVAAGERGCVRLNRARAAARSSPAGFGRYFQGG